MLVFMNFQGRKCTNFFVNLTDFFKKQFNYIDQQKFPQAGLF